MINYIINQGETLLQIAQKYNVTVDMILQANPQITDPSMIFVGQVITIPIQRTQPPVAPPPPTTLSHTITKGETLSQIAQKYNVTVDMILQANPQITDPSMIFIGQVITIPIQRTQPPVAPPPPTTLSHTITRGETLSQIAQKYNVTVDMILQANPQITDPSMIFIGQVITIPIRQTQPPTVKPTIEVLGYTMLGRDSLEIVQSVGKYLTYLAVFSYWIDPLDGGLSMPWGLNDDEILRVAKQQQITPLMVITNETTSGFSGDVTHNFLLNAKTQSQLINNLIKTMEEKGYKGVNVDFEAVKPDDRDLYNQFISNLASKLQPLGYSVSSALHVKTTEVTKGQAAAHDYKVHGDVLDFVVLMTYDWGWKGGPPMAISPINQVEKVLNYAITKMPANKIMMGIPFYAYDWPLPSGRAKAYSQQTALNIAANYGVPIQYDMKAQSPFFLYVDGKNQQHMVWFENATSIQAKYNLVKKYGLKGVAYWQLLQRFPENWPVLQKNFNIKKMKS